MIFNVISPRFLVQSSQNIYFHGHLWAMASICQRTRGPRIFYHQVVSWRCCVPASLCRGQRGWTWRGESWPGEDFASENEMNGVYSQWFMVIKWDLYDDEWWWFGTFGLFFHILGIIIPTFILTGWCFGTFGLVFPSYWEHHHPNWRTHIFQDG